MIDDIFEKNWSTQDANQIREIIPYATGRLGKHT